MGAVHAAAVDESVEVLEHGALVGGREELDSLEPFEESSGFGCGLVLDGLEAEELVGGHSQGSSELGEHSSGRLGAILFVVGDDTLRDSDRLSELGLSQSATSANLGKPSSEAG